MELRGDNTQTMIPPSVHPNGKQLSFTAFNLKANKVDYDELVRAVNLLAACAEIAQRWQEGLRHDLVRAFSGFARKQGLDTDLVWQIVQCICKITSDREEQDRLNTVRSTFSKPIDDLIGYMGLVECLGQSTAKRIADRITTHSGKPTQFEIIHTEVEDGGIVNFGQFSDKVNVTEAKMGSAFAHWLTKKAVMFFQKKQWMIWNGCYWEVDQRSIITKLAYQFVTEAKEALFDCGKYSGLSNLSQFESLSNSKILLGLLRPDCAVSATDFDTDPLLLASSVNWIDLRLETPWDPTQKSLSARHSQLNKIKRQIVRLSYNFSTMYLKVIRN